MGGYFACDFLIALNANETEPGGKVFGPPSPAYEDLKDLLNKFGSSQSNFVEHFLIPGLFIIKIEEENKR